MPDVPETQYVKTPEGLNLAYKVFGGGHVDLLFFWQDPVAFDACFEHPGHLRYWRFVSAFARVIAYDSRGIGASDPTSAESLADRRLWVEDALRVLDAAGVKKVVIQGEGFGGHTAIALAAAHPERTTGLVLINSFARMTQAESYPFGLEPDEATALTDLVSARWGTGDVASAVVPHLATESSFREFCGRFERISASRAAATTAVRAMFSSDVRDLLASIRVPTLVMHTGDLSIVAPEHSRYLAQHIPGATLIESAVESFWGFDPSSRRAVHEFITGISDDATLERELLAVLFTDIVASTEHLFDVGDAAWRETIEDHDAYVRSEVTRNRGAVIKHTGDGHLATFAHPTDAIRAAIQIRDAARVHGVEVRSGMHFGEVTTRADGDITGSAVNIAARVMALAAPGEVLASRTVSDVVSGSSVRFYDRGEHHLKGIPGTWQLLGVDG